MKSCIAVLETMDGPGHDLTESFVREADESIAIEFELQHKSRGAVKFRLSRQDAIKMQVALEDTISGTHLPSSFGPVKATSGRKAGSVTAKAAGDQPAAKVPVTFEFTFTPSDGSRVSKITFRLNETDAAPEAENVTGILNLVLSTR